MVKAGSFAAEKYLLDSLNRIGKNPLGYSVLYVNVSKLKPKNRHPEFVKIFAKLFDGLVGATNGLIFILSNGDFAILGKNITQNTVEEAVKKLRQGLSSDPILYAHDSGEFAHVYEFPEDFSSFYQYIERMIEEGLVIREVEPQKFPLQAHQVDDVIAHMDRIDIAEIVKHQSVMRLGGAKKFEVLFQEFFVAVKDLSMQFNKSIDLVGNKWLFLFLTQTLDRKTISSFDTAELSQWPHRISLNLNLSSVFSKEFVSFAKNFLKDDQKIIVEVQMMDVFNNLPLYFEAKDLLHRGGHQLLIDATSPEMLHMLNIKRLEPDWIKIFWDPIMEFDANNEEFRQLVEDLGREKIILAKSLDEKSVRWGMSHGISAFQGPYIDNLEVAIIRSQCPGGKECNAVDCLKRRRLLAGAFRDECRYKEYLEKLLG